MKVVVSQNNTILYEANVSDEDLLNHGEIFIGREKDCHFVLDSYLISRHHAVLRITEGALRLESLSKDGIVKINGVELKEGQVDEGSKIEIGDFEITFSQLDQLIIVPESEPEPELELGPGDLNDDRGEDDDLLLNTEEELDSNATIVMDTELEGDDFLEPEGEPLLDNVDSDNDIDELGDSFEKSLDDESVDELGVDGDIDSITDDGEFSEEANLDDNEFITEDNEISDGQDDISDNNDDSFQADDEFATDDGFDSDNNFEDNDGFDDNSGFEADDGFGESDDGFGGDDDEATKVLQSFASYSLKIFGEFAAFDSYNIVDNETFIGRDADKCQIHLNDSEVSKVHALIKKTLVSCTVEDLDSSNGIILNGERINKAELSHNDEFIIGDTTFTVVIESDIIEAERGRLMPVAGNQEIEIVEEVEEEVDFDEFSGEGASGLGEAEEKSFLKRIMKDPKKRKIYLGLGVALLLLVLFDGGDDKKKKTTPKKNKNKLTDLKKVKVKYSPEQLNILEQDYALALSQYENGQFNEAMLSLDSVLKIDPNYKKTRTLKKLLQEGLDEIARLKQEEQEEKERKERQVKIANYLEKARAAVKEKNVAVANNFFSLIFELDPENPDVPPLKIEIEAFQAEELRKKQVVEIEKARRQGLIERLAPGKALYIKKEYYKAIDKLEKFINSKDVDEDLLKEGTQMLLSSKSSLKNIIGPLTSKARSFKEGQDLKQSYETYGEILKIDPTNEEALNERDSIVGTLRNRSMKIYREALIAESLSLFQEAKEKFQEVQQVSPINSEYYIKATDKLKNYLE